MKPILEYQDYHAFMSDYYEERKRTSAFSWREFAKIAGFASPSYLKMVCEGKTNLSKVCMERVAHAMGLVGYEVTYFKAMVQFVNAKKDDLKKKFLEEMLAIAVAHRVRVVDKDAFEYYDGWKNPVVRELAPMMPGAMPGEIAKACVQDVSALEVRKSLQFLERAGFLRQVGENTYEGICLVFIRDRGALGLAYGKSRISVCEHDLITPVFQFCTQLFAHVHREIIFIGGTGLTQDSDRVFDFRLRGFGTDGLGSGLNLRGMAGIQNDGQILSLG